MLESADSTTKNQNMYSISSKLLKTDVICVKIYNDYILSAIGDFVYMHQINNGQMYCKFQVFKGTKICGFNLNSTGNKLIIYGETELVIKSYLPELMCFETESNLVRSDWTLDAKWIENDTQIITVTMNNSVTLWSCNLEIISNIICEEQCIAYCACIINNLWNDIIILSGTVFNDLLIWKPSNKNGEFCPVRRLNGHKGVLFSINYNKNTGYICTTSDDRSTIVWHVKSKELSIDSDIEIKYILHGHLSRVFNCKHTDNYIISCGEDGIVNLWDLNGKLLKKFDAHLGDNVWALDCNENRGIIVTGGGDGGVNIFPIKSDIITKEIKLEVTEIPKKLAIIDSNSLVIISEIGHLLYVNNLSGVVNCVEILDCMKSYCLLEVSECREKIAIAGFNGEIYIYEKDNSLEIPINKLCFYQIQDKSRIFSMHWLSSTLLLTCTTMGFLFLWELSKKQLTLLDIKQLPVSKERFSTTACLCGKNYIAIGDRKGNIYLYNWKQTGPIHLVKKAHNYLGITKLYYLNGDLISLGRDSTVKTYKIIQDKLIRKSSDKLPFSWLTTFQTSTENLPSTILGFSGDNFIIWDHKTRRTIFKTSCGGGHRSWDILRDKNNYFYAYIKDKLINTITIPCGNIFARNITSSFHSREVNTIISLGDQYLITGGEDTTLRIHKVTNSFQLETLSVFKSHLSSIRTLNYCLINDGRYLIISGGGRAQIILWEVVLTKDSIECLEKYSHYDILSNDEAETRIMDVCSVKLEEFVLLFAARSDGAVQTFKISTNNNLTTVDLGSFQYCLRCILKITTFVINNSTILLTMATDGKLVFWNLTEYIDNINDDTNSLSVLKPFTIISANKSGINSFHVKKLVDENRVLIITGGDDNAIVFNLLEFDKQLKCTVVFSTSDCTRHCAQITGICSSGNMLITTAVDQKVILYKLLIGDNAVNVEFLTRYDSSVADIQGMVKLGGNLECLDNVAVYGKGLEILCVE